jgi:hypothetical protein
MPAMMSLKADDAGYACASAQQLAGAASLTTRWHAQSSAMSAAPADQSTALVQQAAVTLAVTARWLVAAIAATAITALMCTAHQAAEAPA